MALALVGQATKYGRANLTLTMAMPVPAGDDRLLMVSIGAQPTSGAGTAPTITSITYGGVAMTVVDATNGTVANNPHRAALYYLVAPTAGTANIVVTMGSDSIVGIIATAWSGAAQTSTFGTAVKATGTSTTPTVTVTSAVDEVVIDAQVPYWNNTAGAGQTAFASNGEIESSYEAGAASVVMSWTIASQAWATTAIPIKPSSAVSPPLGGGAGADVTVTSGELRVVPLRAAPWGFSQWQDPAPRNLLANGDFETDTTGWTGISDAIFVRSAAQAIFGSYSLAVTADDAFFTKGVVSDQVQGTTAYHPYTAAAWVLPANGQTIIMGFNRYAISAVGDGTTWQHLKVKDDFSTVDNTIRMKLMQLGSQTGVFYVDGAEMYATTAMLENNAAALEASGQYPKVLMGTIDGAEIVYDDVWTLPSVAPSGVIAFTGMPTANSPSGSLVATTQDLIAVYPFPYGVSTNIVPYPRFARSRSDAGSTTDLVPSIYLSTWDAGDVPHTLVGVHIIAEQMTPDVDRVGISWRWGDTAPWSVPQFASNADAWFEILGENFGTKLSVCVTIYDAVTTDPIGPGILSVIPWVEELEVDGASLPEQARSSPEGA